MAKVIKAFLAAKNRRHTVKMFMVLDLGRIWEV